ncbi:nematocyst expressed protein 3-like [Cydia splendana]|uniref:nematocyst expressed protein 3-like n=1 Tax=Cydia splendana TaxID=1100963 RepID=UPI00300D935A
MYCKLVFVCLAVGSVRAAPAATDVVPLEKQQPTVIPIVSQSEELENNGTYKFSYETGNGIKREETSYDKVLPKAQGRSAAGDSNEGGESEESNEVHVQQGSYSYTAPDGTVISVRYIADENGFRPIGDHIAPSIVAAAAAAGSSAEKLNAADSANSASAPKPAAAPAPKAAAAPVPKAAAAPAPKAAAAPAPEQKSEKQEVAPASAPVEASTTETAKTTESEASGENASEASPSTTDASTTSASSEATDASEASTPAEATTKSADATTPATSEEPSSTSADASTTEAASTTAA